MRSRSFQFLGIESWNVLVIREILPGISAPESQQQTSPRFRRNDYTRYRDKDSAACVSNQSHSVQGYSCAWNAPNLGSDRKSSLSERGETVGKCPRLRPLANSLGDGAAQ